MTCSQITTALAGIVFSGISVTTTYPPHNALAVGPSHIVMIEGSRIEWTDLNGGSPTLTSTYDFFASLVPTGGLYDPRVVYDGVNRRYIVIMQYGASGATISKIDIAVSKDSDPNDGWYFTSLNTSLTINGKLTASDRPMVSVDGTNIYITTPQFEVNGSGYAGTETWVISATAGAGRGLYNGGTPTIIANELTPSDQGYFAVVSGDNGKTYYASDYSADREVVVALQVYDKATNTFGPIRTAVLGNIDQGGTYTAQQQGTHLLLEAGDKRIGSLFYSNGFLYGVSEIKPIGSSVPAVHWFKLDVSNPDAPTLVAQGDVTGAAIGNDVATFNGSIAVDAAGHILINFTASGPNMYPADYYAFQDGNDPVGSFSAPILYQTSTGFFDAGDGSSIQRWGLNSSTVVDPNNPHSFWLSNEYVADGWWQTSIARVSIQNVLPSAPTVTPIVASGAGISKSSGDLNAGKAVTLTVNFSTPVLVDTAAGAPTLSLGDGGIAVYTDGSGTNALTPLVTSSNTAFFTFGTSNAEPSAVAYAYKLDGATTWTPVTGNTLSLSGLANGSHAIQVQATDAAGNVSASPTDYKWTVSRINSTTSDDIGIVVEENHSYSQSLAALARHKQTTTPATADAAP